MFDLGTAARALAGETETQNSATVAAARARDRNWVPLRPAGIPWPAHRLEM